MASCGAACAPPVARRRIGAARRITRMTGIGNTPHPPAENKLFSRVPFSCRKQTFFTRSVCPRKTHVFLCVLFPRPLCACAGTRFWEARDLCPVHCKEPGGLREISGKAGGNPVKSSLWPIGHQKLVSENQQRAAFLADLSSELPGPEKNGSLALAFRPLNNKVEFSPIFGVLCSL